MNMLKGIFLGSAAGLVAVTGAQAADLPVKAKPVEYVKICSLYGAGFYYIPGSDICLKIGGYVRADYGFNVRGARTPNYSGANGAHDRTLSEYSTRHRAHFDFDSRTQTAYGTLRTFIAVHINNENQNTVSVAPQRAFIQWAGFTFGHTKSFSDIPGTPGDDTFKSLHQTQNQSDTGANGTNQIAYTWELGNGMTLNLGADERRIKSVSNFSNNVTTVGSNPTTSVAGMQNPNPYVNFAVNQAWGRLGVSAIFNNNHATYYTAPTTGFSCAPTGTTQCGYPDDKWGWAVLSGIDIKAPWISPGDHFGGYFNYGVGAAAYSGGSTLASPGLFGSGNNVALGVLTDAVYVNGSGLELTTAWTAGAGYEHFWLPNVATSVYGNFTKISYSDTVVNNRWFCGNLGFGTTQNIRVANNVACDPGFNYWTVGSRTDWYPVKGFRLAVDVLYARVETAFNGEAVTLGKAQGARPTGVYTAKDLGTLSVVFRAQRNF